MRGYYCWLLCATYRLFRAESDDFQSSKPLLEVGDCILVSIQRSIRKNKHGEAVPGRACRQTNTHLSDLHGTAWSPARHRNLGEAGGGR